MKTFRLKGCADIQFTVEVEAENADDAWEDALAYIDQEKLDAMEITGLHHLDLYDIEEVE